MRVSALAGAVGRRDARMRVNIPAVIGLRSLGPISGFRLSPKVYFESQPIYPARC